MKKGLSSVIAITLVVLLTFLAVTILFTFIIPSVSDNLEVISQERVELSIQTEGGYTVWDEDTGVALVRIKRGNDDLDLEAINFKFYRGQDSLEKTNFDSNNNSVPEPGQTKTYGFDLYADNFGKPSLIRISPVVGGVEQEIADSVGSLGSGSSIPESSSKTAGREEFSKYLGCLPGPNLYGEIQICTCEDLQDINDDLSADYILGQDINCSETLTWGPLISSGYGTRECEINECPGFNPLGREGIEFNGSFDGKGYQIKDLYIHRPSLDGVGLFGATLQADISNIELIEPLFRGYHNVGGIAGTARETNLRNIFVMDGWIRGQHGIGGIVGRSENSYIVDSISGNYLSGGWNVGGITGHSGQSYTNEFPAGDIIENTYSTGEINGTANLGGLIGSFYNGELRNSFSTAFVFEHHAQNHEGGIAAYVYNSSILNAKYSNLTGYPLECVYNISLEGEIPSNIDCTAIQYNGTDYSNIFNEHFYNASNEPLKSWNFENVWQENSGNYPTLKMFS